MRIQETDNILKEARFSRKNAVVHDGGPGRRAMSAAIVTAAVVIVAAVAGLLAWRRWS